jgi:hypothetical protein
MFCVSVKLLYFLNDNFTEFQWHIVVKNVFNAE